MHYGISLQWGPNTLLYNTKKVKPKPHSWGVLYSSKYKGKITVPDNPIQIADAALYLSKTKPSLGIKDPYELNQSTVQGGRSTLLKKQTTAREEVLGVGRRRDRPVQERRCWIVGASWPYQTNTLLAAKAPVKDLIPKEGATGWADTWMISSKAKHPNCAVSWIKWVSTPKVQAQQAIYFGETPANTKACPMMDKLSQGLMRPVPRATQREGTSARSSSGRRRSKDCGNGQSNCMDYTKWQQAWTDIKS